MVDHGARDHATWAASSTARNWHCSGALALSRAAPPQKESIHAATGTAVHQIAERCLRTGADPAAFLDTVEKTKEREIEIGEDEVNSAAEYVNYVRGVAYRLADELLLQDDKIVQVEQRFSLAELDTPFDAGGTGDAVLYTPPTRHLEIVDLKNGMGVVDVSENKQLRTYALGAMLANPGLDVETITVTIVQPRAPHKDGRIRSETFHVAELIEWTAELLAKMGQSKQACDEYDALGGNTVLFDEWAEKWLKPGKCSFCPAEGFCPALRKKALDAAAVWLDDLEQPRIANAPGEMSPEKLGQTLDLLEMIENWIKAVRAHAHTMAEHGATIPGYQLVEKIGNRKWAADEAKIIADLKTVAGLTDDEIYDRKVRSVAQIEKVLGAKRKDKISNMWMRPVTGTNLASTTKSTRPAVKSKAEQFLETEST
ncbi:DUF2800 domain-containing protein [Bosea lathyri]|uniref:PD-(D/E)XK nuclease superfamily protein n=1 Tax=Bosea lathyri TaxID=1036778 RepID=A0A1H6BUK1_9HYPH|nr:DUF2800 domain-containing protein [Bosea lathyri]SEG64333.1 Protein of unknown function [Bosea lathyri]